MIGVFSALIPVIDELVGAIQNSFKITFPVIDEVTVGRAPRNQVVPTTGLKAGLIENLFDEFPDLLLLNFSGRIIVGYEEKNPPPLSSMRVTVKFELAENPSLNGRLEEVAQVGADGRFTVLVELTFRADMPKPIRLVGVAQILPTTIPTEEFDIKLENQTLDWFIEHVTDWERVLPMSDHLQFVAKLRKTILPSPEFAKVLRRYKAAPPLFSRESEWGKRLLKMIIRFQGKGIAIGHVLIGIESNDRQKPDAPFRVDLLTTWAGDLGGALEKYLLLNFYTKEESHNLSHYLTTTASPADLIGDIDGVNLSFTYDPISTLAENLRAYYENDSPQRFSLFVKNTKTNSEEPALALEQGASPPRLTNASRTFITEQIRSTAAAILLYQVVTYGKVPKSLRSTALLPEAEAALKEDSPEMQMLVQYFVNFIEAGLEQEQH